jgi:hypothetical protein
MNGTAAQARRRSNHNNVRKTAAAGRAFRTFIETTMKKSLPALSMGLNGLNQGPLGARRFT